MHPRHPLDYASQQPARPRSWLNRVATVLCAVCFGVLAVGVAIEATTGSLLFETYISFFTSTGVFFAVAASLTRAR